METLSHLYAPVVFDTRIVPTSVPIIITTSYWQRIKLCLRFKIPDHLCKHDEVQGRSLVSITKPITAMVMIAISFVATPSGSIIKDPLRQLYTPFGYFLLNLALSDLLIGLKVCLLVQWLTSENILLESVSRRK